MPRLGKYKVGKHEAQKWLTAQAIGNLSLTDNQLINANKGLFSSTLGVTGVLTATAKSVHTAGLSATTGNIECVVGTIDLQNGGTVSQGGGAKTTTVVLSTSSGQITMDDDDLGAGAEVSFTVTNTLVSATDVVVACHGSGGTAGAYLVQANSIGSGS